MGIGRPVDIIQAVEQGIDMFDLSYLLDLEEMVGLSHLMVK